MLRARLPRSGLVLEVASGSGEHAAWFAADLPHLSWQPTDRDPEARASIAAWRQTAALPNLLPPLELDAAAAWPVDRADAIVCINMIHIAPWTATLGLLAGAATVLPAGGVLYLYGPFREAGVPTAPGNEAFDADLRARNPAWGLRDLDQVAAEAARNALDLQHRIPMPANNLSLLFRRR